METYLFIDKLDQIDQLEVFLLLLNTFISLFERIQV